MFGILLLEVVYELVRELKFVLRVFVEVYIYVIVGFVSMIYIKVVEVGVDIIDIVIFFLFGGIF